MTITVSAQSSSSQQPRNLFDYSEDELIGNDAVITYYEILNLELYASQATVKKSFRSLSLRYHPDKTQRGEDDYVFRAIKNAYDTLYDPVKRQAYDSTKVPFDDTIPSSGGVSDKQFYKVYKPVFDRNLRFDARLRPELKVKSSNGHGTSKNGTILPKGSAPPSLGDDDTPIEHVNAFYNYWIHYESWRDFSAQATDELDVESHLENAESRDERRWLQREIEKRAKQLKRVELQRIQTLVERAMDADPRLGRQRAMEKQQKQEQAAEKQRALDEQKKLEQEHQIHLERLEREERDRLVADKLVRDKEKKLLRKTRQQFRRLTSSLEADDISELVESLCTSLSSNELNALNEAYEVCANDVGGLDLIRCKANELQQLQKQQQEQKAHDSEIKHSILKENECISTKVASSVSQSKMPWIKDELSALAKGVKKYPAGSSSRWETIASFVNHSCPGSARTREECVEKYNKLRSSTGSLSSSMGTVNGSDQSSSGNCILTDGSIKICTPSTATSLDTWSSEQDEQLQDGLALHPPSMDKNERWDKIARGVSGKSKKECVQRFKTIRESLIIKQGDQA